jgi:DNA primase
LEAGLLTESERSEEPYDRFRGRITFSIESLSGKVLGFGGRVLDSGREGSPKYLNSPESPIYHKGQVLYGLSWAKNAIRREEVALVVEGYMDVVALASAGFENVVAPLGTALTPEQAALLKRYTKKVCLLFDSDAAGLKATFRAADTLLAGGLHPSVVTLPPGEDPDTIVRKEGSEGLRTHIDRGVDVLDRKLQILDERDHFASIEGTRSAIDRLLPTIRATRDSALRDIYVAKVAERTGVRRETLEEELKSETHRVSSPPPRRPSGRRMATPVIPPMGAERELLLLMTKDRDWIERVGEHLSPDDFVDLSYAAAFESLLADHELTHAPPEMASAAASVLEGLLADPKELRQAHRVFEESLGRILSTVMQERLDGMDRLIENTSDEGRRAELLAEKAQLGKERRELGLDWSAAARKTLMSDY